VQVLDVFVPRNVTVARRVFFVLTAVGTGATLAFTVLAPDQVFPGGVHTGVSTTATVLVCLGMFALGTALWMARRPLRWAWAVYPLLTVLVITALDLLTRDPSVAAQVFFMLPVLYAGAQLRRLGAIAVCIAAVVGDALVNALLLPGGTALSNACFVGAALAATAAILVHSAERTERLIAQLEHQATIDPLTGLYTRRVLDGTIDRAGSGGETALLLLDLDRFKRVNDVHGHPAGDAVLRELAALLNNSSRRTDVVGRVGGDEIAVLLPGCSLAAAQRIAGEIVTLVREHVFDVTSCSIARSANTPKKLRLTVSIGVAHLPSQAATMFDLYAVADASLYDAKENGRDRVGRQVDPQPTAA
jgi:diguanylate cyclase (GGDEF)-like protein